MYQFSLRFCLLLPVALLFCTCVKAQLCSGSLGDPVVNITFGSGPNPGPASSSTNISYFFNDCPLDGSYTIRNNTGGCFNQTWFALDKDHTGDPNGYFMLVNASFQPGDFYLETVKGLCGNTTYEFASWVMNVQRPAACGGRPIKPNLTFSIETISGTKLATFNSGDVDAGSVAEWKQYGMFFTTPPDVSDVVLRITNNAPGGCGNDLALDDITFRPCGATTTAKVEGSTNNQLSVCAGSGASRNFMAALSGGYVNPEVQWQESKDGGRTWGNIAGATTTSFAWSEAGAGNFQYRILVAEKGNIGRPSCRIASNNIQVVVQGLPPISMAPSGVACEGRKMELEAKVPMAGSAGATAQWITPGGAGFAALQEQQGDSLVFRLSKVVAGLNDAGSYILKLINALGCTAEDTSQLTVHNKPAARFTAAGSACIGSPVNLQSIASVENSTIAGYAWSWGVSETSTEKNIAPVFTTSGSFPVRLWVSSATGCSSDTVQQMVEVNPFPVPAFQTPDVCLADAFAQFTNTSSVAGGGILTYRWSFGDPQNPAAVSSDKNPRYRYNAVGQYTVKLEATSASGCRADTTQVFSVNGSKPKAMFSLNTSPVRCSADSVLVRNASSVDFGAITRVEIYWKGDNDANALTVDEDPAPGKEYRFDYSPFVTSAEGRFSIRFVAYSGVTCMNETVQEITVHKSPAVTFDALEPLCKKEAPLQLSGGRELTGISGVATYSGTGVDSDGRFLPMVAGAGNHTITYRFTTIAGCADTARQDIQIWQLPLIDAGPDRTIIAGGSITLNASAQGTGLQFQWMPGASLSDAKVLQPAASPGQDVVYRITATNAEGCVSFDDVLVQVVPGLYIPNAFTPNGDGINDSWNVPHLESIPNAEVRVFNRYGQEVFFAKGSNRKWDGRLGGKDLPIGVYVYMVDLKNGKVQKGTVSLLR